MEWCSIIDTVKALVAERDRLAAEVNRLSTKEDDNCVSIAKFNETMRGATAKFEASFAKAAEEREKMVKELRALRQAKVDLENTLETTRSELMEARQKISIMEMSQGNLLSASDDSDVEDEELLKIADAIEQENAPAMPILTYPPKYRDCDHEALSRLPIGSVQTITAVSSGLMHRKKPYTIVELEGHPTPFFAGRDLHEKLSKIPHLKAGQQFQIMGDRRAPSCHIYHAVVELLPSSNKRPAQTEIEPPAKRANIA